MHWKVDWQNCEQPHKKWLIRLPSPRLILCDEFIIPAEFNRLTMFYAGNHRGCTRQSMSSVVFIFEVSMAYPLLLLRDILDHTECNHRECFALGGRNKLIRLPFLQCLESCTCINVRITKSKLLCSTAHICILHELALHDQNQTQMKASVQTAVRNGAACTPRRRSMQLGSV